MIIFVNYNFIILYKSVSIFVLEIMENFEIEKGKEWRWGGGEEKDVYWVVYEREREKRE